MASGQTTNYQLNQGEAEDKVLRTEFNADNAKIDGALANIPKLVTGTFVGNGAVSQTIPLEFTPRAVYVCTEAGLAYSPSSSGYVFGGLALKDHPSQLDRNGVKYSCIAIGDHCFVAHQTTTDVYEGVQGNISGRLYYYIAIS